MRPLNPVQMDNMLLRVTKIPVNVRRGNIEGGEKSKMNIGGNQLNSWFGSNTWDDLASSVPHCAQHL